MERFWSKVNKSGGCWLWIARKDHGGYGTFKYKNRTVKAHRMAYMFCKGDIPEGLQLDHLCRTRHCVNPSHLEAVTQQENILRGEGLAAINARKTHCKRGHELSGDNLRVDKKGKRGCLICIKQARKVWYEQNRIEYYKKNRDKILAQTRKRYWINKEKQSVK